MERPIPLGALLRQRYLIQQVLGQGGFGRTYLALDQERFNEPCVLKELTVPYQDDALVEKSKTLFQREASILYQIDHPQIPRFWAAFEDEHRLFLVQSFIEGQTYRHLLSARKQQGSTFSEPEVLHFLSHLLPVLAYIHDRDIIHRDISLENIILRRRAAAQTGVGEPLPDLGLPVLIDFGAVKEATSHWPLTSILTRVGKVGYAPPEQLQTGNVSPNSDLYALAATSLVLLTGREPQALLDSQTLTWKWQAYASLSEELASILRKMLSIYPGDRYQSAHEVLSDLQPLVQSLVSSTLLKSAPAGSTDVPMTQLGSGAPGARALSPTSGSYAAASNQARVTRPPAQLASGHHTWQGWAGLGRRPRMGIAALFLGGLGVVTSLLWHAWSGSSDSTKDVWVSGAKLPQSEASRIIESPNHYSANSILDPSAKNSGGQGSAVKTSKPPQLIQFPAGRISTVLQGTLQKDEQQPYIIKAAQGQIMTVTLEGSQVLMNLLRSNQAAIDPAAYQTRSWTGQLPADDQYLIQVSGSGPYSLDVAITPLSRPSQEQTQRVALAPGATSTSVTGTIAPNQIRRYLLKAKRGQLLIVTLLEGTARLSAIAPNGQRVGGTVAQSKSWQGRLPMDGDYVIEVSAAQAGDYALSLEVF